MKSGEQLIDEFSNITVDFFFGDYPFKFKSLGPDNEEIEIHDEFDFVFQKKFKRPSIEYDNYILLAFAPDTEYYGYLNNLRLNFFNEINEILETESSSFRLLNIFLNFRNRFKEVLGSYSDKLVTLSIGDESRELIYKQKGSITYSYERENCGVNFVFLDKLLDSFLTCQTITIELVLTFLDEKIELIKTFPREQYTIPSPISIKASIKIKPPDKESFELNPEHFDSKLPITEKLQEFKNLLLQYGYIEQIDFREFSRVFNNQPITQPITWLGTPSELYYIIKKLYDQNLIIRFKNYWSVACKCFLAYDKKNVLITPYYLQRCKAPKRGEQLRKLNSILDTLQ
jgi:hypothetical protein